MRVVALVPRRADGGPRDELWAWVRDRWPVAHPGVDVYEGHHDDGPFNRSAAINTAAAHAGEWDIAVIADADSFVSTEQLDAAVALAADTHRITFAFNRFHYLTESMTVRIMGGYTGSWRGGIRFTMGDTCSSQVVVSRRLWDTVGGFDEGFVGWGMEDIGFSLACQALGAGMERIPGDVWHLYHPISPENDPNDPLFQANVARMERYKACNYNPRRMRALLDELAA